MAAYTPGQMISAEIGAVKIINKLDNVKVIE